MENLLAIMQATDELLRQAEANLAAVQKVSLDSLQSAENLSQRIELLTRKCEESADLLGEKKERVLEVVVRLARLIGMDSFDFGVSEYYQVNSSAKPIVFGYRHSTRTDCALENFARRRGDMFYYHFCSAVLEKLPAFLQDKKSEQGELVEEVGALKGLLQELETSVKVNVAAN